MLIAEAGKVLAQKVQGSQTKRHRRFRTLSGGDPDSNKDNALTWPPKSRKLPLRYPFPSSYSVPDFSQLLKETEGTCIHCIFNQ